ncbi:DUF899 domain-containing protein [Sorangium sp. KYC3313]|uniref:DUF899 domain-containing protein n=1 Tax=Sorangium sp. KYC3313 TaxID=3449740 RepID=UPI003F885FA4
MTRIELPRVVSRAEWLEARKALLAREKELTRARDRLNADRRRLPMVEVTEPYEFSGAHGKLRLLDLFEGRQQLIVYHFMWLFEDDGTPKDRGCPSCSGYADQISKGHLRHWHNVGTTFALISRAPWEKIAPFKARMGWPVPWYSSAGSRFNHDYHVTLDESVAPVEYNYRTPAEHEQAGSAYYLGGKQPFDLHGLSCFLRDGERVYHTYSTYGRGTESTGGSYCFLDLTALGRQEEWEEPKGRSTGLGAKAGDERIRYPDEQEDLSDSSGARPAVAAPEADDCCSRMRR